MMNSVYANGSPNRAIRILLKYRYFTNFSSPEFAKSGAIIREDVILPPGPLSFPATMLDQLRKLGMIVEIDDTVVHLRESYTAATAGVALTPEQAKALAHLDMRTVNFSIKMLCYWFDGTYEEL
jgi:Insertion domain in 60S ribosomal protein L10P